MHGYSKFSARHPCDTAIILFGLKSVTRFEVWIVEPSIRRLSMLDQIKSKITIGDRILLMQTFVQVVEAGNLSSAARQLNTTQPTVTRRIGSLERFLGVTLLVRSTHHVELTEVGTRCYASARVLLEDWKNFETEVRDGLQHASGKLRVSVPSSLLEQATVLITKFLEIHPGVDVELTQSERVPDFASEHIDCALYIGELKDGQVSSIALRSMRMIVVAAPSLIDAVGNPENPNELSRMPWIGSQMVAREGIVLQNLSGNETTRVPINLRLCTESSQSALKAALEGAGVTITFDWMVSDDILNGRLVQIMPEWQGGTQVLCLVHAKKRIISTALLSFIRYAKTI